MNISIELAVIFAVLIGAAGGIAIGIFIGQSTKRGPAKEFTLSEEEYETLSSLHRIKREAKEAAEKEETRLLSEASKVQSQLKGYR